MKPRTAGRSTKRNGWEMVEEMVESTCKRTYQVAGSYNHEQVLLNPLLVDTRNWWWFFYFLCVKFDQLLL